ncbi:hypothetical protein J2S00_000919 [Caldalkalibacillus uzonensis]|uniref:Uncharacterized protein n=1 Tax=Caldalkalibacillus uzonensis TaxID=353224 RepID=A0ABU0CNY8_9BACI|nr:hypothetical protein [Caldalkalibacillus uzonensis]
MNVLQWAAVLILGSWVILGFLIFKTDWFRFNYHEDES